VGLGLHFAVMLLVICLIWKTGAWRNWSKYHTTMMYFAVGNLTYNFLTANHFLWKLNPDILPNHSLTEILYSFITFPGSALLFLNNFPDRRSQILQRYVKWVFIYVLIEWIFMLYGRIIYQYGWSLMWSAVFDIIMFPMLLLHSKRPLIAYVLSILLAIFWIKWFDVPVNIPIENR
jgi:hypothetical protein